MMPCLQERNSGSDGKVQKIVERRVSDYHICMIIKQIIPGVKCYPKPGIFNHAQIIPAITDNNCVFIVNIQRSEYIQQCIRFADGMIAPAFFIFKKEGGYFDFASTNVVRKLKFIGKSKVKR
jgi:hypothetical protein